MDAAEIDVDTEAGQVEFTLFTPVQLDFAEVAELFDRASYELRTIEVEAKGRLEAEGGAAWFVIAPTGQRVRVEGEVAAGATALRGRVVGWESDRVALRPLPE